VQPARALGVVPERGDVLHRVGDVVQPRCRADEVEVDQAHGLWALPDHVPRTEVAVAHHVTIGGLCLTDRPGRVAGRREAGAASVQGCTGRRTVSPA
jgi:hypothetical protein